MKKYQFQNPKYNEGYGWYVGVIGQINDYLHIDGNVGRYAIRDGDNKRVGYFPTRQDAELAIKTFLDKQESKDCDDNNSTLRGVQRARLGCLSLIGNGGEIMQRKLTGCQKRHASEALANLVNVCQWDLLSEGYDYWAGVCSKLASMIEHGTTGGKPHVEPYVEPEPPIPDGYRKAVAGDEGRPDCEWWNGKEWVRRWFNSSDAHTCSFTANTIYIVHVDRVPNDDEAKERPIVMVRDGASSPWQKCTLVFVRSKRDTDYIFTTTDKENRSLVGWKYCRHLYPGE